MINVMCPDVNTIDACKLGSIGHRRQKVFSFLHSREFHFISLDLFFFHLFSFDVVAEFHFFVFVLFLHQDLMEFVEILS